jgi:predicted amidohydrolase
MKIAVYQGDGVMGEVAANLAVVERVTAEAAAGGAGLVVFPEMFLTGYNIGAAVRELAEPSDGPSLAALGEIAQKAGTAIVCGYPERAGDRLFNSAVFLDAEGETLANYRKSQLFGAFEMAYFTPGSQLVISEFGGIKVGFLICYDIEFPEPARHLAQAGVQLLLVPTALMAPGVPVARRVVPSRACENQIFVAYANRPGREGDLDYVGESCIVGPDGDDLARAVAGEALIMAEIDPAAITACRRDYDYLADLRSDLTLPSKS